MVVRKLYAPVPLVVVLEQTSVDRHLRARHRLAHRVDHLAEQRALARICTDVAGAAQPWCRIYLLIVYVFPEEMVF